MSDSRFSSSAAWRRVLMFAGGVAVTAIAGVVWFSWPRQAQLADHFPLDPLSSSRFLNSRAGVAYVGSQACKPCHGTYFASYARTGMGRSMGTVNPDDEPPDAVFDHPASKRRYHIVRKHGQMWHRELLLTNRNAANEVVLAEFPLKYVVGSGRHSRTYLVEADGFLVESPVTWYTTKKAWGMSPGYDKLHHAGFERATGESCLICHAGQADAVGKSLHHMRVMEPVIGCERCHGPGSLHRARHQGNHPEPDAADENIDYTIVNPAHLPRDLAEAICQQCHLRSSAAVVARGRRLTDFRPGLPMNEFRHDYRLETSANAMTVVGHVEQMHLSRCYQRSENLSCLSCHDPHHEPSAKKRAQHYRSACLRCHQVQQCNVEPGRRERESPQNNCVDCHMPRSPTEIPHLAFTHHRIGIHGEPAVPIDDEDAVHQGAGRLKLLLPPRQFSAIDRKRSLGLALLETAVKQKQPPLARDYERQALQLLNEARAAGLRDSFLDASLARLNFAIEADDDVLALAEGALNDPALDNQERCNALFLVADAQARRGYHEKAIATLRELNSLRRHSLQWLLLAKCERALGRLDAEAAALENAVRINTQLTHVHAYLADYYRRQGKSTLAAWHQDRADVSRP